ncbi:DUF779 domain-containing protein [Streptomyces sp. CG1]|uniref:DUF779 domain-containing protein n=1 Tax=Streptomyces sp. CG1 TaxID=1287523 RepID=UPI0034E2638F
MGAASSRWTPRRSHSPVVRCTTFRMSAGQYANWRHTLLTVGVVPDRGGCFALEVPEERRGATSP